MISHYNGDIRKLMDWLCQYFPFPEVNELMSISTGIIGDKKINCHISQEVSIASISKMVGGNFYDRVNSLGVVNVGVPIDDDIIPSYPLLIFHGMCIAKVT